MVEQVTGNGLEAAVAARFRAVNGDHPMTDDDDAYVSQWYVPLERLAADARVSADELGQLMLSNRLPLPSYIRSDGAQMVTADLLLLAERASRFEELPGWFAAQFPIPSPLSPNGTHIFVGPRRLPALGDTGEHEAQGRAGGPTSRGRLIDTGREQYPLVSA